MESIWKNQSLSDTLESEIVRLSTIVQQYITNPPGNANVSEYCKRRNCWDGLLEQNVDVSSQLKEELISGELSTGVLSSSSSASGFLNEATKEEQEVIDWVCTIPAAVWLSISKWAKDTNNLQPWQRGIAFSVGTLVGRGKKPSVKQAKQAEIIYQSAKEKGFVEE